MINTIVFAGQNAVGSVDCGPGVELSQSYWIKKETFGFPNNQIKCVFYTELKSYGESKI